MAVRRDRAIPAPMRIEMLGADQMRRERVRNIHVQWLVGANCHRSHKGPWIASFRLPGTFRTELAGRGFQACQHRERTTQTKGRLVARTSAATSISRGSRQQRAREQSVDQTAAMVCTSTRKDSFTSRSTMRSVFGGYFPFGNIFGNSRRRNAMNLGMSCEWTRYVVN
jgi:hypothetical protein